MSRLLTIQEASDMTRLAVKTLYAYVCRKEVPYVKLRGRLLFDQCRLQQWIDAHAVEPASAAVGAH